MRSHHSPSPRVWRRFPFADAFACVLAVCASAACDVGQPLVGERDVPGAARPLGPICPPRPSCDSPRDTTLVDLALPEVLSASFETCGRQRPDSCFGEVPDPGDPNSPSGPCGPIELHQAEAAVSGAYSFSCTARALLVPTPVENEGSAEPVEVSLLGTRWTHANLRIETRAPLVLVLSRAELYDVRLSLAGPVTLRFLDGSSLEDVRVVAEDASSDVNVRSAVELDNARAQHLVVGGALQSFPGIFTARRSALSSSVLRARHVELESVSLDAGQLQSEAALLTDVVASRVRFDLTSALLVATELESSVIVRCESLRMQQCAIYATDIAGCAPEPLRAYDTRIVGGRVGGLIEGDDLSIQGALLGVDQTLELVMWSGKLVGVNFCEHMGPLSLHSAHIACSECADGVFEDAGSMCRLGPALDELDGNNFCSALDDLRLKAEPCEEPKPVRLRPHMGL